MNVLPRIFSILLLLAASLNSVNAQSQLTKEQETQLAERWGGDVLRYLLFDHDNNGWEDPWEKEFPAYTQDKDADPDGDGISN